MRDIIQNIKCREDALDEFILCYSVLAVILSTWEDMGGAVEQGGPGLPNLFHLILHFLSQSPLRIGLYESFDNILHIWRILLI